MFVSDFGQPQFGGTDSSRISPARRLSVSGLNAFGRMKCIGGGAAVSAVALMDRVGDRRLNESVLLSCVGGDVRVMPIALVIRDMRFLKCTKDLPCIAQTLRFKWNVTKLTRNLNEKGAATSGFGSILFHLRLVC